MWGKKFKDHFFLLNKYTTLDQGASHTRALRDFIDEIAQHVCCLLRMGKYTKRLEQRNVSPVVNKEKKMGPLQTDGYVFKFVHELRSYESLQALIRESSDPSNLLGGHQEKS